MRKRLQLLSLALAGLVLAGCGPTRIGRILADPMHYSNRRVTVEGRVTGSVGAFIAGGYRVEDPSGKIIVISGTGGVPRRGSFVRTTGFVTPGVTFLDKAVGTTIRETHHSVKW